MCASALLPSPQEFRSIRVPSRGRKLRSPERAIHAHVPEKVLPTDASLRSGLTMVPIDHDGPRLPNDALAPTQVPT
jgi:hypothetical protein